MPCESDLGTLLSVHRDLGGELHAEDAFIDRWLCHARAHGADCASAISVATHALDVTDGLTREWTVLSMHELLGALPDNDGGTIALFVAWLTEPDELNAETQWILHARLDGTARVIDRKTKLVA